MAALLPATAAVCFRDAALEVSHRGLGDSCSPPRAEVGAPGSLGTVFSTMHSLLGEVGSLRTAV